MAISAGRAHLTVKIGVHQFEMAGPAGAVSAEFDKFIAAIENEKEPAHG